MSNDRMKNIVLDTSDGQIVLDQRIETRLGWVAGVNFIYEDSNKKAHAVNENVYPMKFARERMNVELGHQLAAIMRATGKVINFKLTGTFETCEDCALQKAI